ncbi:MULTISPECIES: C39 family peptidase [Leptospira]|uniref:C39 family peptidase n=1 Tax=Leptospira TaxID=171 RepID=UPI000C2A15B2|nr:MULTISPECIES: C39 family peptidase [Leptospira]PJZ87429.1 hypothetical protein CH368_16935 [Leptospira levettii]TGN08615.1 hypothetical protein EHR07_03605 [Leptospira bandrabouensis]
MAAELKENEIRPDIPSYVSITPWITYDSQMDNAKFVVAKKNVVPSNQCQGTTYLNAVKWTDYKLGINKYLDWTEERYYKELARFAKTKSHVTEYEYHNKLFDDLFAGKATIKSRKFTLKNIKDHIEDTKAPVIFSIDVREAFNPKAKAEMGHVVMAVGKDNNGISAHDPRGKFFTNYKDLDGNQSFFPDKTIDRVGRKSVGIYCVTILKEKN